jgi:EthD domain
MAVKFVVFIKRRPGMTREEFVDHHRDSHAETFMADPTMRRLCRKYVQSHPVPAGTEAIPESPFDGIAEAWFGTLDDLREAFSSATYMADIRTDELRFMDLEHSVDLVTEEYPVWPRQPGDAAAAL